MNKKKLTSNLRGRKDHSPTSCVPSSVPQVSISTKANGEKNGSATTVATADDNPAKEMSVHEHMLKLAGEEKPDAEAVEKLRQQIVSSPAAWKLVGNSMASVRHTLVEKMSDGALRAIMLAETDILAKQLGNDAAPMLDRLLIDQILTARLRLVFVEKCYNQHVIGKTVDVTQAEYYENLLTSAQARFVRAVESLARVRRLARNTPALQINIAKDGGKQVNVLGNALAGDKDSSVDSTSVKKENC